MSYIIDYTVTVAAFVLAIVSAGHALLSKRDPKASLGWMALCLMIPLGGAFMYFLFGINRVRTRAIKLWGHAPDADASVREQSPHAAGSYVVPAQLSAAYADLLHISDVITNKPLVGENRIDILHNGEHAYTAMLSAIESAQISIVLTTYIFETNETGRRFIDALGRAVSRGVDVRVIIDGFGELYSWPRAGTLLKKRGVPVARFLPPRLFPPSLHINLRNHRKILIVDGVEGFTGGMNIGDRHLAERIENPNRVVDIHFRLAGPIVEQVESVFFEDWRFLTGRYEKRATQRRRGQGSAICRVITEGPNEDLDKLSMILVGAVSSARSSVIIMTPYFIPPRGLLAALQATALKGVEVTIILPEKNNLALVHWASRNMLWELLERGVRIFYQPAPFVHTKLFIVDDHYVHIGSANIDPRSLRLNFELAVEVYDRSLALCLAAYAGEVRDRSRPLSLQEIDGRPFPEKVRDALAWLLSPYL